VGDEELVGTLGLFGSLPFLVANLLAARGAGMRRVPQQVPC
jgi:hypothetical protein